MLQNISKRNKDIYARILKQESHYGPEEIDKNRHVTTESLSQVSKMLIALSKQAMAREVT